MANPPSKSKTKESIPRYRSNASLFGPPPLLVREDAVSYDELFARFRAAVKPVDIFDEMFVADLVALECDILQFRRWKSAVIYMCLAEALKKFLWGKLNYRQYLTDEVVEDILENARDKLTATVAKKEEAKREEVAKREVAKGEIAKREVAKPEVPKREATQVESAESLVDEIMRSADTLNLSTARKYLRGEPKTVALVDKLFAKHDVNLEAIAAEELSGQLPAIAQIDRAAENAKNLRNEILREIDRRRALFAETLRRTIQEVEDAEYQVIETPPTKGKH